MGRRGSIIGPLRLIRCAPKHPNRWMIGWRRRLPEWDPVTSGRWETLPPKLTEANRREFGIERADPDEPEKVRLLEAFAPIACFQCDHPDAPKARKEIVEIIRAIRHREPLPRPPGIEGDLPVNRCRTPAHGKVANGSAVHGKVAKGERVGNLPHKS